MSKILVIDDDKDICSLLHRFLSKKGYKAETAFDATSAINLISKNSFDLILSDFRLPEMTGLDLLAKIKELNSSVPVIIITAYSDVKVAVNAMKQGAYDYVTKPIYPDEILHTIEKALNEVNNAPAKTTSNSTTSKLVNAATKPSNNGQINYVKGNSRQSGKIYQHIKLIAPTDMTVIINGETGTGKEYVAREIHSLSKRSKGPFLAIDCGALPKDLAGSEFFGHVKGAFTGAINDKTGSFELANGGTLFLDEIGNLTYDIQVKLLRVLQERKVRKIGGSKDVEVDVRIVVATNEDLKEAVQKGDFREDLFHRLNEYSVKVPALRTKPEDIIQFTSHFLQIANKELNKEVEGYTEEVKETLIKYPWYGNLRELKNVIKRCVLLADEGVIDIDCLPDEIIDYEASADGHKINNPTNLKAAAEFAEREAILNALDECGGNKSKAAKLLNIDRKTLYNKLKSYDILVSR